MVDLKRFQNKAPFKHVHETKERLRRGVCEHHGMVLLCGLVPCQAFSSKWLTLGFVKRWCICGFSSPQFHSFGWFTRDFISLLHIPPSDSSCFVTHGPPCTINPTKEIFLLMCVYVIVCLGAAGWVKKWLITLANIWIFTSSTPQVFFKHRQTMSSICFGI